MTNLSVRADSGVKQKVNVRSPYNNSYFGKEEYLIPLGYSESGEKRAVITFPDALSFHVGSISAYSVDMSRYKEQVSELNRGGLRNIVQSANQIEGDVSLKTRGVMVFSIPYGKGWSASVDGRKTDLLTANTMYMALPLEAGTHHIVLQYETPYLKDGALVSLASILIFGAAAVYNRKRDLCEPHTPKHRRNRPPV